MASRAVTRSVQPPKVLPPPSPFGELLRRSNFASYDPAIRQTYTAPASYVHRGNWGLKRPIANRQRHSAIVLRQFEEHAHFIEWDKAPAQVDLIRRVEELHIKPTLLPNFSWALSLGPSADAIDSEFCPSEGLVNNNFRKPDPKAEEEVSESSSSSSSSPTHANDPQIPEPAHAPPAFVRDKYSKKRGPDIDYEFGNNGKGGYGPKSSASGPKTEGYLQPNIAAMTPRQFEDYLEELTQLRPQFMQYVRKRIKGRRGENDKHNIDPENLTDAELMLTLSAEVKEKGLHRNFLGQHTQDRFDAYRNAAAERAEAEPPMDAEPPVEAEPSKEAIRKSKAFANAPQPIQGQPHILAGLIYSKPTKLETYYFGRAEPGLILQHGGGSSKYTFIGHEDGYVAAFAGLAAKLAKEAVGTEPRALIEPFTEEGLAAPIVSDAAGTGTTIDLRATERDMRMVALKLISPPKVVGVGIINQTMVHVKVLSDVVVESAIDQNSRANPYKPGSLQFNGALEGDRSKVSRKFKWSLLPKTKSRHGDIAFKASANSEKVPDDKAAQNASTLDTLQSMIRKK